MSDDDDPRPASFQRLDYSGHPTDAVKAWQESTEEERNNVTYGLIGGSVVTPAHKIAFDLLQSLGTKSYAGKTAQFPLMDNGMPVAGDPDFWYKLSIVGEADCVRENSKIKIDRNSMPKVLIVHGTGRCENGHIEVYCTGIERDVTWHPTEGLRLPRGVFELDTQAGCTDAEGRYTLHSGVDGPHGLYTFTEQMVTCPDCLDKRTNENEVSRR